MRISRPSALSNGIVCLKQEALFGFVLIRLGENQTNRWENLLNGRKFELD